MTAPAGAAPALAAAVRTNRDPPVRGTPPLRAGPADGTLLPIPTPQHRWRDSVLQPGVGPRPRGPTPGTRPPTSRTHGNCSNPNPIPTPLCSLCSLGCNPPFQKSATQGIRPCTGGQTFETARRQHIPTRGPRPKPKPKTAPRFLFRPQRRRETQRKGGEAVSRTALLITDRSPNPGGSPPRTQRAQRTRRECEVEAVDAGCSSTFQGILHASKKTRPKSKAWLWDDPVLKGLSVDPRSSAAFSSSAPQRLRARNKGAWGVVRLGGGGWGEGRVRGRADVGRGHRAENRAAL